MKGASLLPSFILIPVENVFKNVVCCLDHIWKEHKVGVVSTFVLVASYKIHAEVNRRKNRQKWDSVGENVVMVHSLIRGKTIPGISPFLLKLETYLRMAGIQYEFDADSPVGPKGKTPWITLNGEDYGDSQLIMDFLGKKFNKDFTMTLTDAQKGAGRALAIMADEHLFWGLVQWRWITDPDQWVLRLFQLPFKIRVMVNSFRKKMKERMDGQGIGLHTDEEIQDMTMRDLHAISLYLGQKKFIMGDEPCEFDCAIFSQIAQLIWACPGSPYADVLQSKYRNLLHYAMRMKEKFWPDWDRCLDN